MNWQQWIMVTKPSLWWTSEFLIKFFFKVEAFASYTLAPGGLAKQHLGWSLQSCVGWSLQSCVGWSLQISVQSCSGTVAEWQIWDCSKALGQLASMLCFKLPAELKLLVSSQQCALSLHQTQSIWKIIIKFAQLLLPMVNSVLVWIQTPDWTPLIALAIVLSHTQLSSIHAMPWL